MHRNYLSGVAMVFWFTKQIWKVDNFSKMRLHRLERMYTLQHISVTPHSADTRLYEEDVASEQRIHDNYNALSRVTTSAQ